MHSIGWYPASNSEAGRRGGRSLEGEGTGYALHWGAARSPQSQPPSRPLDGQVVRSRPLSRASLHITLSRVVSVSIKVTAVDYFCMQVQVWFSSSPPTVSYKMTDDFLSLLLGIGHHALPLSLNRLTHPNHVPRCDHIRNQSLSHSTPSLKQNVFFFLRTEPARTLAGSCTRFCRTLRRVELGDPPETERKRPPRSATLANSDSSWPPHLLDWVEAWRATRPLRNNLNASI